MNTRPLVEGIRRGDPRAFEALYHRTKGAVLAYARSWTRGNESEAEDLAQEAFLGLLRTIDTLRSESDPLPYLLASVRNRARDRARAFAPRTTRSEQPFDEGSARTEDGPALRAEREERTRAVLEALERLPESQAEAVRLHLIAGLGWDAAGAAMRCPPATARTRYRAALDKLQHWLGRYVHEQA